MMTAVMNYAVIVARLYEKALTLGSLTLNTADEYVMKYESDYSSIDQYYRLANETYFGIEPTCELFEAVQKVKRGLDQNYSKLCNRINLEWIRCLKETGGMDEVHLLRQYNFYDERIKPIQKKVAVIVSDALRYEVAQESEERRVGKECNLRVDLGGRRIIKKIFFSSRRRHTRSCE